MKKKKLNIAVLLVLIAFLVFCYSLFVSFKTKIEAGKLQNVYEMLVSYIRTTDGCFPSSKDDLATKGYLREKDSGPGVYEVSFDKSVRLSPKWATIGNMDDYHIAFDTQAEELAISEYGLCRKRSGEPFFLLRLDDDSCYFQKRYSALSMMLYFEMLEQKAAQGNYLYQGKQRILLSGSHDPCESNL